MHWQIEQPLSQLWPAGPSRIARVGHDKVLRPPDTPAELLTLDQVFPHGLILLDLETCGLAGSMIFLAGLLYITEGEFRLVQLWARDYSEEKPLLQSLWNAVQPKNLLITYNGKSFDWTQVHDRSTLHRLGYRCTAKSPPAKPESSGSIQPLHHDHQRPEPMHLDLLHHARRRWRGRLPNFRLQTLERYICGRQRTGDIPGRDIPAAYHEYVRSGNLGDVEAILHHNALDLVTLLQLVLVFLEAEGWREAGDGRLEAGGGRGA